MAVLTFSYKYFLEGLIHNSHSLFPRLHYAALMPAFGEEESHGEIPVGIFRPSYIKLCQRIAPRRLKFEAGDFFLYKDELWFYSPGPDMPQSDSAEHIWVPRLDQGVIRLARFGYTDIHFSYKPTVGRRGHWHMTAKTMAGFTTTLEEESFEECVLRASEEHLHPVNHLPNNQLNKLIPSLTSNGTFRSYYLDLCRSLALRHRFQLGDFYLIDQELKTWSLDESKHPLQSSSSVIWVPRLDQGMLRLARTGYRDIKFAWTAGDGRRGCWELEAKSPDNPPLLVSETSLEECVLTAVAKR